MIRASRAVTRPLIAAVVWGRRSVDWGVVATGGARPPAPGGGSFGAGDGADGRTVRRGRALGLGAQRADGPVHGERAQQQGDLREVEEREEDGPDSRRAAHNGRAAGRGRSGPSTSRRGRRRVRPCRPGRSGRSGRRSRRHPGRAACCSTGCPRTGGHRNPRPRPRPHRIRNRRRTSPRGGAAATAGRAGRPAAGRTDCRRPASREPPATRGNRWHPKNRRNRRGRWRARNPRRSPAKRTGVPASAERPARATGGGRRCDGVGPACGERLPHLVMSVRRTVRPPGGRFRCPLTLPPGPAPSRGGRRVCRYRC
ncbi:hypothetical protein SMICM304S_08139 [Streptomyces microflavus]